jgi:hypothetical protein
VLVSGPSESRLYSSLQAKGILDINNMIYGNMNSFIHKFQFEPTLPSNYMLCGKYATVFNPFTSLTATGTILTQNPYPVTPFH